MRRRPLLTVLAVVLALPVALFGAAAPAHADGGGSLDMWSTAVVTRLSLTDGHGWLTVHPTFRTGYFSGFQVQIPAGDGVWSGPDTVAVPELATTCRRQAGAHLYYLCLPDEPSPQGMPLGGYQVTIPVSYSGDDADTLWGTSDDLTVAGTVGFEGLGSWNPDTFPVYLAGHFLSSAELRVGRESYAPGSSTVVATAPVTLTVVPGERVTALTIPFLGERFVMTGNNAASHGLQCYVRVAENDLHCKPAAGTTSFPVGRYTVTSQLQLSGGDPDAGQSAYGSPVLLTVDGQPPEIVDTGLFWWVTYN